MVKLLVAALLLGAPIYFEGCADVPELDDVHDQQLQGSYNAPGRPAALNLPATPDIPERQPVPGE